MRLCLVAILLAVFCGLRASAQTQADPEATAARGLIKTRSDAVVFVHGIMHVRNDLNGRQLFSNEFKFRVNGTIIDPSGLTVVSYSQVNPNQRGGILIIIGGGDDDIHMGTHGDVTAMQIEMGDGTEIPARLVMKDPELDLLFLAPDPSNAVARKFSGSFTCVPMQKTSAPQIMDHVITLGRAEKQLNRTPVAGLAHIGAVITKPRLFYDIEFRGENGTPVFNLGGEALGILVSRDFYQEILPAADVADVAQQARKAREKLEARATTAPTTSPASPVSN